MLFPCKRMSARADNAPALRRDSERGHRVLTSLPLLCTQRASVTLAPSKDETGRHTDGYAGRPRDKKTGRHRDTQLDGQETEEDRGQTGDKNT